MSLMHITIGDWVSKNNEPIQVNIDNIVEILTHKLSSDYNIAFAYEPIKITEDILLKNGIKLSSVYTHPYRDGEWEDGELEEAMKHYPMYVYQTSNSNITFVIRPNEQELKVHSSNYKTIVEKEEEVIFVHELQHALKMCGIEMEIVL